MLRRRIHCNVAMALPACAKITTKLASPLTMDSGTGLPTGTSGPADPLLKHRFPKDGSELDIEGNTLRCSPINSIKRSS